MKTIFRLLILVSIAAVVAASMVPLGNSDAVTLDLNQKPSLTSIVAALTPFLGFAAFLCFIASAIGLFFLRAWSRPLSMVATVLVACFIALIQALLPFTGTTAPLATALLSVAGLAWFAVLWLSHSKSLDPKFIAKR
jgi:hypothetical protein